MNSFRDCGYGVPLELTSAQLRRGKWTSEEEVFADKIRLYFIDGRIDLTAGTTLRTYLSNVLHCDPMRITKKFTKEESVGKQMFIPREATPEQRQKIASAMKELNTCRDRWYRKLFMLERENLRKETLQNRSKDCRPVEGLSLRPEDFVRNEIKVKGLLNELLTEEDSADVLVWMSKAHKILAKEHVTPEKLAAAVAAAAAAAHPSPHDPSGGEQSAATAAETHSDSLTDSETECDTNAPALWLEGSRILPGLHARIVDSFRTGRGHASRTMTLEGLEEIKQESATSTAIPKVRSHDSRLSAATDVSDYDDLSIGHSSGSLSSYSSSSSLSATSSARSSRPATSMHGIATKRAYVSSRSFPHKKLSMNHVDAPEMKSAVEALLGLQR